MEAGRLTVPVGADLGPITADLEKLRALLGQTETQTQGVTNAMRGVERQSQGLTSALRPLATALAGVFSVRALIQFTDTWTDLTSRVNLAAGSIERGGAVMEQLQVIARRTYSSLEQTTESYIRNAQTLRDLGKSTQETLDYTEALNNALVVSGARADRAARVSEALGRGLAAGALRGTELNTVIESGGRVAELLAEELGTTVSGLRKFGQEGKITGDVINRALVGNLEKLREEAESMPATIGDAFQLIANALLQTIGVFDTANEISGTFAESLIWVADNMQRVVTYVATGAAGWAAYSAVVAATNAGLFTLNGALALTRTALVRTGLGAIIVLAGELVYQIMRLVEATGSFGKALDLMGEVAVGVWEGLVSSARAIPPGLNAVWLEVQAGFIDTIRTLQLAWNDFLSTFEGPALTFMGREIIGGLDLSRFKADVVDASDAAQELQNRAAALRTEAAGLATEGFDKAREALAKLNVEMEGGGAADLSGDGGPNRTTSDAGGSSKLSKAEREAKRLAEAYKQLVDDGVAFIEMQEVERQTIGLSAIEADKLRARFELLNDARRAGIELTPDEIAALEALADAQVEAKHTTDNLREAYEFSKDVFKGFFTDLIGDLRDGASVWEALGNAAVNALQKIADKALDLALNGIFDLIFGAFGSGGGFGSIIGNLFKGFANGTSYAPGGMAVVGERGPELVKLPGGSQVVPNNRVMAPSQASFGGSGGNGPQRLALDVFVKDNGKIGAIARQEAAGVVEVAIHDYDQALPDRIDSYSKNPRQR